MASTEFIAAQIGAVFELTLKVDAPSAWIVSDSSDPAHAGGFGRILVQRYHVAMNGIGPGEASDDAAPEFMDIVLLEPRGGVRVANDNVAWITDVDGNPVIGRDPAVAALSTGDTLIAWIGVDGHVHAKLYPFSDDFIGPPEEDVLELVEPDKAELNALIKDLGEAAPAEAPLPGTARRLHIAELNPGNIAIMWIALAASGFAVQGKLYSYEGGDGGSSWSERKLAAVELPFDFSGEFSVASLGETGVALTYEVADGATTRLITRIVDDLGSFELPHGTSKLVEQLDASSGVQSAGTSFTHIDPMIAIAGEGNGPPKGVILIGAEGDDVLVGADEDDILIGDMPDMTATSADGTLSGGNDVLIGGLGSDILFGGPGNDVIDGGRGVGENHRGAPEKDVAVYLGNAYDYSITINGDGSYTVLDGRTDGGARGPLFGLDGVDKVSNVEEYRFLNGDLSWLLGLLEGRITAPPGYGISSDDLYHLPDDDHRLTGNVDQSGRPDSDPGGVETVHTPVGWGMTAEAAAHGQKVTDTPEENEKNPVSTATSDGFAVGWQVDNGDGTSSFKIAVYDTKGDPKSVGDGPGTVIIATTSADSSVPGALGGVGNMTAAAWSEKTPEGEVKLTLELFNESGAPIGTGSLTVTSGPDGTSYTDLSIANQSLPSGASQFSVIWIENPALDGSGDVMVQTYGVPEDPASDPVALGQDGDARQESDYAPDEVPPEVVGNDKNEPYKLGEGSSAAATGLYGGDLGVVWVEGKSGSGGYNKLKGVVLSPTGDTLLNIDLSDYGRDGDIKGKPKILEGLDGDILVAWMKELDDDDDGYVIELAAYKPLENGTWGKPVNEIQLRYFDEDHEPKDLSITVLSGNQAGLIVTWKMDGKVYGQQYDYSGQPIGGEFKVVGSSDSSDLDQPGLVSLADGRFVVTYLDGQDGASDVGAQILDPRGADAPVIGDGSAGTYVGTVFDDILDGQEAADKLYGALGNDVLVGGMGDDRLYGGEGDDHLIGGSGTDVLLGEEGNDWLQGGHGRDYISGGAGVDTLSYKGEARGVIADLETGKVLSEADHNAAVAGAGMPGLDPTVIDGKTYTVEDLIGTVGEDGKFRATQDIENLEGGLGNDTLRGDAGDNVLRGDKGDDILEGRGGNDRLEGGEGHDTAVFSGNIEEYEVKVDDRGTSDLNDDILTISHVGGSQSDGTDTLTGIESFQFNGTIFARADLNLTLVGSNANDVLAGGNGNDRIEGGGGDDLLSGGYGNDTFVFKPGFGSDVVLDFSNTPANDDTIEVSSSLYASYEAMLEAQALAPDGHGNVIFALGDDTIVFKGLDIRTLDADDFKFF